MHTSLQSASLDVRNVNVAAARLRSLGFTEHYNFRLTLKQPYERVFFGSTRSLTAGITYAMQQVACEARRHTPLIWQDSQQLNEAMVAIASTDYVVCPLKCPSVTSLTFIRYGGAIHARCDIARTTFATLLESFAVTYSFILEHVAPIWREMGTLTFNVGALVNGEEFIARTYDEHAYLSFPKIKPFAVSRDSLRRFLDNPVSRSGCDWINNVARPLFASQKAAKYGDFVQAWRELSNVHMHAMDYRREMYGEIDQLERAAVARKMKA